MEYFYIIYQDDEGRDEVQFEYKISGSRFFQRMNTRETTGKWKRISAEAFTSAFEEKMNY